MDLETQLAALLKAMQAIVDGAKAAERELTADEVTELEEQGEKAKQLKARIERAAKGEEIMASIAGLGAQPAEEPGAGGQTARAKSLGEHVALQIGGKLKGKRGQRVSEQAPEFKAATDVHVTGGATGNLGAALTTVDTNLVTGVRRQLTIEDLLGSETISGSALTYFVEGALEGAPTTVGENGQKPQIHFANPTPVTEALAKVAAFIKESDEIVEDLPWLVSSINGRLLYQVSLFIEDQLLNGNGTGTNLTGLLNRSGVQTETAADRTDNADALFRAITKVQTGSGFSADGIVVNPADYQKLRLSKDNNGQYYGGGFFAGQYGNGTIQEQPPLWGLRTVVTPAIAAGTALVGSFAQGASVISKGGVTVETTNSHDDDFTNNRITIRGERRLALAARRPAAFVKVTLSDSEPEAPAAG